MSKQKKPRNKKFNPRLNLDKTALLVAENALNRITFIGSSIRRLGPYAGRGFQFTTNPRTRMVATDMLIGGLFDQPRPWKLWVAHLSENAAGEIEAETTVVTVPEYTLGDFCQHAEDIIKTLRNEEAEGKYFGYALVAAPNERYELAESEDALLENFMHSGLLDKSKHLSPQDQFVTREEMTTLIVCDQGKFDSTQSHKVEVPTLVTKQTERDLMETADGTVDKIQAVIRDDEDY